jgi:anti-sigma regulatory factor (Ser/Thr protein kinase)
MAGVARGLLRSACEDWTVDRGTCDDALLVVTELITNVVEHAGTECRLTVSVDGGGLRIEVRDFHQSPPPRLRPTTGWRSRGHGLQIVALLSTQWGVSEHADGKSLWAVLSGSSPPHPPHAP